MKTYYVWRRHSDRSHLDGYVGWSAYAPKDDRVCTYTILHETLDIDEARHRLLFERFGDDVPQHKIHNCTVCWTNDPSLI